MALSLPSRKPLGVFPTPLRQERALGDLLGFPELLVKRDDLTGFSWGGNKVRTVEFLLAEALERDITDLVVAGGPSSNFAATMAAAGRTVDITVYQVAYGTEPDVHPPALLAAIDAGAELVFTGTADRTTMETVASELATSLSKDGRRAMAIPRGGATAVGSMGFVAAAVELRDQLNSAGLQDATIVLPVGSGGSIAGLVAGRSLLDANWSIVGASVSRSIEDSRAAILAKAAEAAAALGGSSIHDDHAHDLRLIDCRGDGFGTVTLAERSFERSISDATGLLIDHTYNTKPLYWLAGQAGELDGPVIYWLTGSALGAMSQLSTSNARRSAPPIDPKDNDR